MADLDLQTVGDGCVYLAPAQGATGMYVLGVTAEGPAGGGGDVHLTRDDLLTLIAHMSRMLLLSGDR